MLFVVVVVVVAAAAVVVVVHHCSRLCVIYRVVHSCRHRRHRW